MSFIPIGQKRLTNIAEIRYRVKKQTFEIACFQNKVIDWRNKNEQNINEVLQTQEIFTNISQGEIASNKLLNQYFPKMKKEEIIIQILEKGEMQLGEKERNFKIESLTNLIINYIAENCVHPQNNRLFSQNAIRQAIKEIHFQVSLDQNEKVQAKKCIKSLEKKYQIKRADMEIEISCDDKNKILLLNELQKNQIFIKNQIVVENQINFICITQPQNYKILDQIKIQLKGKLRILNNLIVNTEILDIEQVQNQNLEIRADFQDEIIIEQSQEIQQIIEKKDLEQELQDKLKINPDGKKCQKCRNSWFENNNEFRQHCKSEWHIFNQQRIIKGQESLNQEDFQFESLKQLDDQFFKNKK